MNCKNINRFHTLPIVEQQGKNAGTIPFLLIHAKYN
jgi:hypothetical protein